MWTLATAREMEWMLVLSGGDGDGAGGVVAGEG